MTTFGAAHVVIVLAVGVILSPALDAQNINAMTPADLLRAANTGDASMRVAATAELFRRGPDVLPALAAAGARPMRTITPPRGDVIYTLLSRLPPNADRWTFGLHVEAGVTREEVVRMGERHGFQIDPGARFNAGASPACYVRVTGDRALADVLQRVLTTELGVRTVNLNVPERSQGTTRPLEGR